MKNRELYENDMFGWAMLNARLLREDRLTEIDAEHIAEELEGLASYEKRLLVRRMSNLIISLIRWDVQPGLQSGGSIDLIGIQRLDVQEILDDCPSLMEEMDEILEGAYKKAYRGAVDITGFDEKNFSKVCPYTLHQILDAEMDYEPSELSEDLFDFADSLPETSIEEAHENAKLAAERDLGVKISKDEK
jgi:hypothetical protein